VTISCNFGIVTFLLFRMCNYESIARFRDVQVRLDAFAALGWAIANIILEDHVRMLLDEMRSVLLNELGLMI
jgi:hypothetical protein